eukprot:SAG31_NODE_7006_length_1822_cov_1.459663_2_plen_317_part_01
MNQRRSQQVLARDRSVQERRGVLKAMPSPLLPLLGVATAALLCGPLHEATASLPPGGSADPCPTAAAITRIAHQPCSSSSSPVADSLRSVGLYRVDDEQETGARPPTPQLLLQLLQSHGFQTALDLRLLDDAGAEAAELMEELRAGGISIGDRSKVRLLLGDQYSRDTAGRRIGDPRIDSECSFAAASDAGSTHWKRQLQGSSDGGGGMSIDTIAIVLSVLVGAAGYLVQVSSRTAAMFQTSLGSKHSPNARRHRCAGVHGPPCRARSSRAGARTARKRGGATEEPRPSTGADPADGAVGGRLLRADEPGDQRIHVV